ncbi:hypothetical protein ACFY5H_33675 [Streptomyces sp. NPDC013012]|uniref:hypothetical protein n=1 Tax=Streptomyces sp. NPDC013012 TaxID=3364860 RepID=UPI0036CED969
MALDIDWARGELTRFLELTELYRPPDPPGVMLFSSSLSNRGLQSDIIASAHVVEARVLPDPYEALLGGADPEALHDLLAAVFADFSCPPVGHTVSWQDCYDAAPAAQGRLPPGRARRPAAGACPCVR